MFRPYASTKVPWSVIVCSLVLLMPWGAPAWAEEDAVMRGYIAWMKERSRLWREPREEWVPGFYLKRGLEAVTPDEKREEMRRLCDDAPRTMRQALKENDYPSQLSAGRMVVTILQSGNEDLITWMLMEDSLQSSVTMHMGHLAESGLRAPFLAPLARAALWDGMSRPIPPMPAIPPGYTIHSPSGDREFSNRGLRGGGFATIFWRAIEVRHPDYLTERVPVSRPELRDFLCRVIDQHLSKVDPASDERARLTALKEEIQTFLVSPTPPVADPASLGEPRAQSDAGGLSLTRLARGEDAGAAQAPPASAANAPAGAVSSSGNAIAEQPRGPVGEVPDEARTRRARGTRPPPAPGETLALLAGGTLLATLLVFIIWLARRRGGGRAGGSPPPTGPSQSPPCTPAPPPSPPLPLAGTPALRPPSTDERGGSSLR